VVYIKPSAYKFDYGNSKISIKDYFKKSFGINVPDDQPLLIEHYDNNSCAIPASLCLFNGIPEAMTRDFNAMRAIGEIKHAAPEKKMLGI
jgi:hypothetical protein